MLVENVKVYGLENSIRVSKYPMATDVSILTEEITENQLTEKLKDFTVNSVVRVL